MACNQNSMQLAYPNRLATLLTTGITYVHANGTEHFMPPLIVKLKSLKNRAMSPPGIWTGLFAAAQIAAHLCLIGVEHEEVSYDATTLRMALFDMEKELADLIATAPAIAHQKMLAHAQETISDLVAAYDDAEGQ